MPIYEYRCQSCGRKQSVFFRSLAAAAAGEARCERCGSRRMARLVSRVRVLRGGGAEAGASDDAMLDDLAGLDENNPRELGRVMRKMAAESGEDMGPEFDEVVGRLERGEDPEKIEQSMGDVFGAGMEGPGDVGLDDRSGSDSPPPSTGEGEEAKGKAAAKAKRTIAVPRHPTKRKPATVRRRKKN